MDSPVRRPKKGSVHPHGHTVDSPVKTRSRSRSHPHSHLRYPKRHQERDPEVESWSICHRRRARDTTTIPLPRMRITHMMMQILASQTKRRIELSRRVHVAQYSPVSRPPPLDHPLCPSVVRGALRPHPGKKDNQLEFGQTSIPAFHQYIRLVFMGRDLSGTKYFVSYSMRMIHCNAIVRAVL